VTASRDATASSERAGSSPNFWRPTRRLHPCRGTALTTQRRRTATPHCGNQGDLPHWGKFLLALASYDPSSLKIYELSSKIDREQLRGLRRLPIRPHPILLKIPTTRRHQHTYGTGRSFRNAKDHGPAQRQGRDALYSSDSSCELQALRSSVRPELQEHHPVKQHTQRRQQCPHLHRDTRTESCTVTSCPPGSTAAGVHIRQGHWGRETVLRFSPQDFYYRDYRVHR